MLAVVIFSEFLTVISNQALQLKVSVLLVMKKQANMTGFHTILPHLSKTHKIRDSQPPTGFFAFSFFSADFSCRPIELFWKNGNSTGKTSGLSWELCLTWSITVISSWLWWKISSRSATSASSCKIILRTKSRFNVRIILNWALFAALNWVHMVDDDLNMPITAKIIPRSIQNTICFFRKQKF